MGNLLMSSTGFAGTRRSVTTFTSREISPSKYSEVSLYRALRSSALSPRWVLTPPQRGGSTPNVRRLRSYREAAGISGHHLLPEPSVLVVHRRLTRLPPMTPGLSGEGFVLPRRQAHVYQCVRVGRTRS